MQIGGSVTPKEAIKEIQIAIAEVEWEYPIGYAAAFDMAIEALEKQVPKKPTEVRQSSGFIFGLCPVCKTILFANMNDYCDTCGQKIDWEKE